MLGLLSPRSPPFHTNRGEPTGHRRLTLHSGEAVTAAASDCPPSFSYIKGICIGGGDHKDERLAGEKEQDIYAEVVVEVRDVAGDQGRRRWRHQRSIRSCGLNSVDVFVKHRVNKECNFNQTDERKHFCAE